MTLRIVHVYINQRPTSKSSLCLRKLLYYREILRVLFSAVAHFHIPAKSILSLRILADCLFLDVDVSFSNYRFISISRNMRK